MPAHKIMISCFLCDREFQFGPHRYEGRAIAPWGSIPICDACLAGNHDGIVLERHPKLKAHLEERGISITLNKKGWLDIPR